MTPFARGAVRLAPPAATAAGWIVLACLCALLALGCTTRATMVEVAVATDAPPDRALTLRATVRALARADSTSAPAVFAYGGAGSGATAPFAGSFTVTPGDAGAPRDEAVEVRLEAVLGATSTAPAQVLVRRLRFRFVPRTPGLVHAFLPVACLNASTGCTTVETAACIVTVRCEEQGLTCGDNGTCVAPDVTVVPRGDAGAVGPPSDARADGAADGPDADAAAPGTPDAQGDGAAPDDAGPLTAPRPIAPLSTARVAQARPTLRWELLDRALGVDGARVLLCRDRALTAGCASYDAPGTSLRVPAPLAAGEYYWTLRALRGGAVATVAGPVWQFAVGARSAPLDTSSGTIVDPNGDGYADVLIGADGASPGGRADAGTAAIYPGSARGPAPTPVRVYEGTAAQDALGQSVASAGDVNGDGFGDLIVGTGYPSNAAGATLAGEARVYLGGAAGAAATPQRVLQGAAMTELFGAAVASAGDVNGDGYADVIVGARAAAAGTMNAAGAVRVYTGGATGIGAMPAWEVRGSGAGTALGSSVAGAGDVNGDGYADVIVGAPGQGNGAALLFGGGSAGLATMPFAVLNGATVAAGFGTAVAGAGDVNGDGYDDVIVGAPNSAPGGRSRAGLVTIAYGSAVGVSGTMAGQIAGATIGDRLGAAVAGAGDVNGDGYADVIVGADSASPGGRMFAGAAYVFHGGPGGLTLTAAVTLTGLAAGDGFGAAVAGAGDVNGDGYADVLVGAATAQRPMGAINAGEVRLFLGSASGVAPAASAVYTGSAAGDRLGASVACRARRRARRARGCARAR